MCVCLSLCVLLVARYVIYYYIIFSSSHLTFLLPPLLLLLRIPSCSQSFIVMTGFDFACGLPDTSSNESPPNAARASCRARSTRVMRRGPFGPAVYWTSCCCGCCCCGCC